MARSWAITGLNGGPRRTVNVPVGQSSGSQQDISLLVPTLRAAATQLGGVLPDQRACHLEAGDDTGAASQALADQGFTAQIAAKGVPAPLQAGRRWPVERTHSWMNGFGKLRRMTDRDAAIVVFYLYLAATFVTVRALIQRARRRYRWDTQPTANRLK